MFIPLSAPLFRPVLLKWWAQTSSSSRSITWNFKKCKFMTLPLPPPPPPGAAPRPPVDPQLAQKGTAGWGILVKSTLEGSPQGMSKGAAKASLPGLEHWGAGLGREASGRPDFPATYPDHHGLLAFKFGDEFVPAEDLCFV